MLTTGSWLLSGLYLMTFSQIVKPISYSLGTVSPLGRSRKALGPPSRRIDRTRTPTRSELRDSHKQPTRFAERSGDRLRGSSSLEANRSRRAVESDSSEGRYIMDIAVDVHVRCPSRKLKPIEREQGLLETC